MARLLPLSLSLLALAPFAAAGPDDPHLVYRRSYAEALLEGRIRGVPVLVSRHKDD